MDNKRELPALRLVLAFLIATVLFITGFLVGYYVSYIKYQEISQLQREVSYELLSIDLQGKFLQSCDEFVFQSISSQLDRMGSVIDILEERFGKTDDKVISQKKDYTLLEIQHFLNVKQFKENCNKNVTFIFFFYSNLENYKNRAEQLGFILNDLKKENPVGLMAYSFDYDLDSDMTKILKNLYNVTSPNTLVINERIKLENVNNIDDIRGYVK